MSSLDDLYRRVIMDHYQNPRNRGELEGDSVHVNLNNPTCGDRIELQMKIDGGKVTDARFNGEGCSISLASASMMTEVVKGLSVDEAQEMSQIFSEMMRGKEFDEEKFDLGDIESLQGVSKFPARIKCATLVWKAMEQGFSSSCSKQK